MEFFLLLAMLALIIWAFSVNMLLGVVAFFVIFIYYYMRRYGRLCYAIATYHYNRQNIQKAFRWFERAEKGGMMVNQKIAYAYYLLREGRVERAEAILTSLLAFPQKAELKYVAKANYAILLLKTGRTQEALEAFEDIFPYYKNSTIYGSLGYIYIIIGNMEKAIAFNQEAYEYNKDDAIILDNMVQLYTKLEDYETAYRYVQELMQKLPRFIEAYYDAAVVELKLGKIEEAKQHLEHALTIRTTFISSVSHDDVQALLDTIS